MFKRLTALLIIFIILFSSLAVAQEVTEEQKEAAEKLVALGILTGYDDGSLKLENHITRAEFTTLAVRIILKDKEVDQYQKDSRFNDVKKDHWASGYINIAVEEGLINGYNDGTFRPENKITYSEVITILVRLLGYDDSLDENKEWPLNYIQKALELGIDNGEVIIPDSYSTRGEVVYYIYNTLLVKLNKEY
ncbi:S-layer homology domain-containing protein [Caldisalinibacter kiritimatiensis]|uniref:Alkaline serine proteinase n=1 Tax=Caldisalinibacter kiritimatiensis TaxID=1304284 RepID=R1AYR2_9FIRM|nr:S-layer homology domain-containing protein [Caldisalinibacter kiritimatiensis]EOD01852.1 Alkaline serine proteinase [Caldisalinibacter kiritimatiensis]